MSSLRLCLTVPWVHLQKGMPWACAGPPPLSWMVPRDQPAAACCRCRAAPHDAVSKFLAVCTPHRGNYHVPQAAACQCFPLQSTPSCGCLLVPLRLQALLTAKMKTLLTARVKKLQLQKLSAVMTTRRLGLLPAHWHVSQLYLHEGPCNPALCPCQCTSASLPPCLCAADSHIKMRSKYHLKGMPAPTGESPQFGYCLH